MLADIAYHESHETVKFRWDCSVCTDGLPDPVIRNHDKKEKPRQMMIFKPETPRRYRLDTTAETEADAPEMVFTMLGIPIIVGILLALLVEGVDYVFFPKTWFTDGDALNGLAFGIPAMFLGWLTHLGWWIKRQKWIERRTYDRRLVKYENDWLALPTDLKAELRNVRDLGYRYFDNDDDDGFYRCQRALQKGTEAVQHRKNEVIEHDAQTIMPEAMHFIVRYDQETAAMFAGELEAGDGQDT